MLGLPVVQVEGRRVTTSKVKLPICSPDCSITNGVPVARADGISVAEEYNSIHYIVIALILVEKDDVTPLPPRSTRPRSHSYLRHCDVAMLEGVVRRASTLIFS